MNSNQQDFKGMRLNNVPITMFFISLIIFHFFSNFILALAGSLIIYFLMHLYVLIMYRKIINKIGFIINKWNIGLSFMIHSLNYIEYKQFAYNYYSDQLTLFQKDMLSCEKCGVLPDFVPTKKVSKQEMLTWEFKPSKLCKSCGNKLELKDINNTLLNIDVIIFKLFLETSPFVFKKIPYYTFYILNLAGKFLIPSVIYLFFYLWYLHPEDLLLLNSSPFWGSIVTLIISYLAEIIITTIFWLLSTYSKNSITFSLLSQR